MGQWVGGEHCAGSHCGPGKEEKRCDNPAGAGAHVLYNASVAVGDEMEHLTTRWVHAVVDDSTQGKALAGVCVRDIVSGAAMRGVPRGVPASRERERSDCFGGIRARDVADDKFG